MTMIRNESMGRTITLARGVEQRRLQAARWAGLLLLGLAAVIAVPAHAAEQTPQERAALEQQLKDAQSRLDDAARDVADLSGKLYGRDTDVLKFRHGMPKPHGAMLGINIGGEQTRADGVEVMSVSPSGPAEAAGLRKGDVITAVDGKPLRKSGDRGAGRQLIEHLRGVEPGQVVKLDYLRDGKKQSASVTTVAAEPPMMRIVREHLPMLEGVELPPDFEAFLGGPGRGFRSLELVPITPKLGQYFGTDKGLLVVRAPTAAGSRLEEGDVILTIGGRTPENPRHAFRILGSYQPSEPVKVEVLRQRKRLAFEMQVPQPAEPPALRQAPQPPQPPRPPASPVAPTTPAAPVTGSVSS
jgi:membrane-associated protease RseP (regulator of RpoE activity)